MFLDPTPLAYDFPTMHSPTISDEDVVDAAPLNQGPPPGTRAGRKRGVWPQPELVEKTKRQKIGVPFPKKQRPVSSG
jgi:hypothetical protein